MPRLLQLLSAYTHKVRPHSLLSWYKTPMAVGFMAGQAPIYLALPAGYPKKLIIYHHFLIKIDIECGYRKTQSSPHC